MSEFVDMSNLMQTMVDSGVNAFAVQLVAESFATLREGGVPLEKPLQFKFKGVKFTIEEDSEYWTLKEVKQGKQV